MYKTYEAEDYIKVVDACTDRMYRVLLNYLGEVEGVRWQINDRYPFPDLPLRWEEVENQESMIRHMISSLQIWAEKRKAVIINDLSICGNIENHETEHSKCSEYVLMPMPHWIEDRPSVEQYVREGTEQFCYNWPFVNSIIELELPINQTEMKDKLQ